jgi:hypothetical protein
MQPACGLGFYSDFLEKTRIFRPSPAGFAFYLLVFSPTPSLEIPSPPPFRAIIGL